MAFASGVPRRGEQRFDNHTDKLTNYIRFWQADGESEKTSIRTKTALGQLVEEGGFKGGLAPYGYDLVKSGRINKRKHECYELAVNQAEAAVVSMIFDCYVNEGYGAQRIATYLNKLGYRARTGKMWHHAVHPRNPLQSHVYRRASLRQNKISASAKFADYF